MCIPACLAGAGRKTCVESVIIKGALVSFVIGLQHLKGLGAKHVSTPECNGLNPHFIYDWPPQVW